MIISEIRSTILRLPTVYINGDGLQDILIIEVITDEGLIGIGEAHTMPTALKSIIEAPISQFAVQGLSLLLIGQDPSDIAGLWHRMWHHCGSVLGGRGLVLHAMSGIDLALWDLRGKVENKPLHQLLGPIRRDKVDVYASDLMPSTADALVARALELKEKGYRFLKFGWGKIGTTPSEDIDILTRVREEIGSDMGLMIDVGVPIPYKDAVWLARHLEPLGVEFLEEPLDATDFEGYSALVSESPGPNRCGRTRGWETGLLRSHYPCPSADCSAGLGSMWRYHGRQRDRRPGCQQRCMGCSPLLVVRHSGRSDCSLSRLVRAASSPRVQRDGTAFANQPNS